MAYDFTLGFLEQNKDLAAQVLKIAQSGEILKFSSEDFGKLRAHQYKVNNVLASIARNMPEWKDIRKTVRCWTTYKNGTYELFVGKPQHRIEGRPPRSDIPAWAAIYVNQGATGAIYSHDSMVDSEEAMLKFTGVVMNLPDHIKEAHAKVEGLTPESLEYFHGTFAPFGWIPSIDGNILVLKRS